MNAQSQPRGPYPRSIPRRAPRALLTGALLAATAAPALAATADAEIEKIARAEQAQIDADLASLRGASAEAMRSLMGAGGANVRVEIDYLGRGRMSADEVVEPTGDDGAVVDGSAIDGFVAFNPATGNEFRIRLARGDLQRIGALTTRAGRDQPYGGRAEPEPREDGDASAPRAKAWSNNLDNRSRLSSLTAATTTWPWRAIVEHDNRCTGTLIGPRHVVTAGHCLYDVVDDTWITGFRVTPGRAGANWAYGRSTMPSGSFSWYFTPAQWRSTGRREFDVGIMVIADRLGDASGWMGYGYLTESGLQQSTVLNRGFPWCNASTDGVPRLDDPADPGSAVPVCDDRHLYGDDFACDIGDFAARDGENFARLFNHSCDASAGHSGSPLYRSGNGGPHVIGVHTFSACGRDINNRACTAADERPLTATRITPEYRDWISYFRNWKP